MPRLLAVVFLIGAFPCLASASIGPKWLDDPRAGFDPSDRIFVGVSSVTMAPNSEISWDMAVARAAGDLVESFYRKLTSPEVITESGDGSNTARGFRIGSF
jgi:hypothetical protein